MLCVVCLINRMDCFLILVTCVINRVNRMICLVLLVVIVTVRYVGVTISKPSWMMDDPQVRIPT